MNKRLLMTLGCAAMMLPGCAANKPDVPQTVNTLRAPAYPLVTIDPYTSGWSAADKLYDDNVRHWTDTEFPLLGVLRVDGKTYRFMGVENFGLSDVAGTSDDRKWEGRYTFDRPKDGWTESGFNDNSWNKGEAPFGSGGESGFNTPWTTRDIWVRREATLTPEQTAGPLYLKYSHDDIVEIYINGTQVDRKRFAGRREIVVPLTDEIKSTAADGHMTISAHCDNTGGGSFLDFGIYGPPAEKPCFGETAVQKSADVQATATHYVFDCGPVELSLSFLAPLLMDDLELISRPVNYISYDVRSLDGQKHDVQIYFEASPAWSVNLASQPNASEGYEKDGLVFLRSGSREQNILGRSGDNVRIDWGHFYLCAGAKGTKTAVGDPLDIRRAFAANGSADGGNPLREEANMAMSRALGNVKNAAGKIMIGYDDIYSIQYFGDNLRPYWNRSGDKTIEGQFAAADRDFDRLRSECARFDGTLMAEAARAGGVKYAELCALAYRQSISAHKLVVSPQGTLLFLSKENNSNGSIGTVDITYPSSPLFLYYNPELAKGLMNHIFYYSESGKWAKPFAAHDVGTYPKANGQTYGGDMPVEESGNMLILAAAIAAVEGNAAYADSHWEVLTVWADYLAENGLDPVNQLCTDDFAGHFAHNVNLSVKAIMGVASYARCAEMLGREEVAGKYYAKAREMARWWMENADDGDHYRLTFDKPGTWSMKYNLVWDGMLGLDIFPESVARRELAYYPSQFNRYGLPLDNRRNYTKADWVMWTASLSDDKAVFEEFIAPMWDFMNETVDRIPMSDWYHTDSQKHVGFKARSVVGGYWIKMLKDRLKNDR